MKDSLATVVDTLRERRLFERGASVSIARAPGRLDVMGGIADYSGSLVLERPIAEATWAAVQRIDRPVLEIVSLGRDAYTIPLQTLAPEGAPVGYDEARQMFAQSPISMGGLHCRRRSRARPRARTAADVGRENRRRLGCARGKGCELVGRCRNSDDGCHGMRIRNPLEPRDLALLCQTAENRVAGAPCGVMDQMTCVFGDEHALLALLCQPAELQVPVRVPDDIELWGLDSGERHAVGGSDYGAVRTGAFMGLRILSEHTTVPGGYLANIAVDDFEHELAHYLPEHMSGDEFLARYGRTADPVTSVERGRRYCVRAPAAHPVYERSRAETFRRAAAGISGKMLADTSAS